VLALPDCSRVDGELTGQYHPTLVPSSEARSLRAAFGRRLRWKAPFSVDFDPTGSEAKAEFAKKSGSIETRHSVQTSFIGF
jgi:hypothetical protein